jgi:gamma-tubulin complex component 3
MLTNWIYQGQLRDPFHEFFVRDQSPHTAKKTRPVAGGAVSGNGGAWEGRYVVVEELVPGFIGEGVAKKVFLIGKSLNFIREDCGEEGYVNDHHAKQADIKGNNFPRFRPSHLLSGRSGWSWRLTAGL